MNNNIQACSVLDFWFGPLKNAIDIPHDKSSMWFVNGKDYDGIIRETFGELYIKACNGELDGWQQDSKTLLALVILLDQFSRHIHRETAQAFAQDVRAIQFVQSGIQAGFDNDLFFIERKFFYMPLMHAENIEIQNLSVAMFTKLRDQVPADLKDFYTKTLSFAESHQYVIEKFGRFPELNFILNRTSTPEEEEFLATGKYKFL
ncbi:MAG: DUF924 family protein [Pseudomonadota bacterium]